MHLGPTTAVQQRPGTFQLSICAETAGKATVSSDSETTVFRLNIPSLCAKAPICRSMRTDVQTCLLVQGLSWLWDVLSFCILSICNLFVVKLVLEYIK